MKIARLHLLAFGATAAGIAACGQTSTPVAPVAGPGSASTAPTTAPVSTATPSPAPAAATPMPLAGSISGVVRVPGDAVIPAGQRLIAAPGSAIVAAGNIEVAGTLQVPGNATVALFAGRALTIDGSIVATAPPITSTASMRASDRTRHPQDSNCLPAVNSLILYASGVTVGTASGNGNVSLAPGQNLAIVGTGSSPTVAVNTALALPTGTNGTQAAGPDCPGGAQRGGSIWIGSPSALAVAATEVQQLGLTESPAPLSAFTLNNVMLSAGNGGIGYNDITGVFAANPAAPTTGTWSFVGSDGAGGGNIEIVAATATGLQGLSAGIGGRGGDAGGAHGARTFKQPIDGTAPGQPGDGVSDTSGSGGDGGTFALLIGGQYVAGNAAQTSGSGTLWVGPGNGGPGGNGGALNVAAGRNGCAPRNQLSATPLPQCTYPAFADLPGGGNGGDSTDVNHDGGAGGKVNVRDHNGAPLTSVDVAIDTGYNGGKGFDGCKTSPQTKGTNGGNGGVLDTGGAQYFIGTTIARFNGGNGGDGNPHGYGAAAGIDGTGKAIGMIGADGFACATPSPSPVATYGPVTLMPSSGTSSSSVTQSFTIGQARNTGYFTYVERGSCSVNPADVFGAGYSGSGPFTFGVSANAAGPITCTVTFTLPVPGSAVASGATPAPTATVIYTATFPT